MGAKKIEGGGSGITTRSIAAELQQKVTKIVANTDGEREGESGYIWLVSRRRALKLSGTPSVDVVSAERKEP